MIKQFLKHYLRNGKLFKKYLKELEATEKYSLQELREYQNEKLRKVIKVAYDNVPFYRRIFKEGKLTPGDIRRIEDLQKLPLIDKKTVQENFEEFKNRNFRGLVFKGHTSGTTGTPGTFLRDLNSINFENAAITWHQSWANVNRKDKRVWLRGDLVVSKDIKTPPFWKTNRLENQLIMSSYHLSDQFLSSYIQKIKEYSPVFMQAYPSTAYVLAKYLERSNDILSIPVIQTSSEPLHSHWRALIEARFQCKIFDYYGTAERVGLGLECSLHEGLHMIPGYGITEFEDSSDNVSLVEGRIIGTTLNNFLMPLIRYKTDDYGKTMNGECACGRKYDRIYSIESKFEDMIVTSEGKRISPSLITFCFKNAKNIEMSQIIQSEDRNIILKIVRSKDYQGKNGEYLVSELHKILGMDIDVQIACVAKIERTKRGKFRWIISKVTDSV